MSTYPKWRYHAEYEAMLVKSDEQAEAMGEGWADNPSAFGRDVENAPDAKPFLLPEVALKKRGPKPKLPEGNKG